MRAALLLLPLLLASCAQYGNQFDMKKADELRPGISTEEDAEGLFGKPESVLTDPKTDHQLMVWKYAYGTGLGTGGAEELAVSFDEDGKMLKIIQRSKI